MNIQNLSVDFILTKMNYENHRLLIESGKRKVSIFYITLEMLSPKYESSGRLYTFTKIFVSQQQRSIYAPFKRL